MTARTFAVLAMASEAPSPTNRTTFIASKQVAAAFAKRMPLLVNLKNY